MSDNTFALKVIVDEGVSDNNLMRFKRFAAEKGLELRLAYGGLAQEVGATGQLSQDQ